MNAYVYAFFASLVLSLLLTPVARNAAKKYRILDHPDEARKIHKKPVPLLGGLAIYSAFVISAVFFCEITPAAAAIIAGTTLLFILGVADDIKGLPAGIRLAVQMLAVVILLLNGISLHIWNDPGAFARAIEIALTFVWVMGITNALNFFDGMDGLAAGMSVLTGLCLLAFAASVGQYTLALMSAALAGSALGFLKYNFKPAKIYMGDAGSTTLGFALASLGLVANKSPHFSHQVGFIFIIVTFCILIYDMIYITIGRIASGDVKNFKQWLEYTGKDHLHHRLVTLGMSEKRAVLFIYFMVLCAGTGAFLIQRIYTFEAVLVLIQCVIAFVLLTILMLAARRETP